MEVEEIKRLIAEQSGETKALKAAAFKAKRDAEAEQGWYNFLKWHCGVRGVANGHYLVCEANNKIMEEYIASLDDKRINFMALERAYQTCKDQLAMPSFGEYERKTNLQESRQAPQVIPLPPPTITLPYTKLEIKQMPREELRKILARGPEYVEALNRILDDGKGY